MRHLRIESDRERNVVADLLRSATGLPQADREVAWGLLKRLANTPDVPTHEEEATAPAGAQRRCEGRVRDLSGLGHDGARPCGLTLNGDGSCPGVGMHRPTVART